MASTPWETVDQRGKAKYDFTPNGEFQLPLKKGQYVTVASKRAGWFKGTVEVDGVTRKGIFPESYIELEKSHHQQAASVGGKQGAGSKWSSVNKPGIALYKFEGKDKFQIPLEKDDKVTVVAESRGWFKGYVTDKSPKALGFFPVSYVKLLQNDKSPTTTSSSPTLTTAAPNVPPPPGKKSSTKEALNKGDDSKNTSSSTATTTTTVASNEQEAEGNNQPDTTLSARESDMTMQKILKEIDQCMGLWLDEANESLIDGKVTDYQKIQERITTLLELRAQLLLVTKENMASEFPTLRKRIIQLIEKSRKKVVGFIIPRNNKGLKADTSNTSIITLFGLHHEMYQAGEDQHNLRISKKTNTVSEIINAALGRKPEINLFQLVVECSMVITTIKEDFHLTFALWNKKTNLAFTEEWSLTFSSLGMARDVLKNKTIFTDLTLEDFEENVYLVCKVYRNGSLLLDKSQNATSKPNDPKYRRPFFVSMARLEDLGFTNFVDQEYTPGREFEIRAPANEQHFSSMPRKMLEGKVGETKQVLEAKQVVLQLRLQNATLDQVLNRNDGELKGVVVSRKLSFPSIFNPGEARNDLFMWLNTGVFLQGSKKAALNVQIVIKVFLDDGKHVPRSIQAAGSPDPQDQFTSSVYYHSNTPLWDEILSLKIDPELLERSHLQFVVYHASTNKKQGTPLSFGWMKLTSEKGAVLPDSDHVIHTYKISSNLKELKGCKYLHGIDKSLKPRKGEEIRVKTKLLSTLKTQSHVLHPLLSWQQTSIIQLKHYLRAFNNEPYSSEQTKRYIKVTMSMLFGMLQSLKHKELHQDLLTALIKVFSNIQEEEQIMMEAYIKNVFNFSKVHGLLLNLSNERLKKELIQCSESLVPLSKSFQWLMQFCVRSYELDSDDTLSLSDFKKALRNDTLELISELLKRNVGKNKQVKEGQMCFIKVLPIVLLTFEKIFSQKELADIVVWLVESIHSSPQNNAPRLNLIRILAEKMAFKAPVAQEAFFPLLLKYLKAHLVPDGGVDECYLAVDILKKLLHFIQVKETSCGGGGEDVKAAIISRTSSSSINNPASSSSSSSSSYELRSEEEQSKILLKFIPVLSYLTDTSLLLCQARRDHTLLAPLSEQVKELVGPTTSSTTLVANALTCTMTFFKILPQDVLLQHITSMESDKRFKFLSRVLRLWLEVMSQDIYEEVWVVLLTLQVQTVCKVYAMLTKLFCEVAEQAQDLTIRQEDVISLYFALGMELLLHRDLEMEAMNQKRRVQVEKLLGYDDPRPKVREGIKSLWDSLKSRRPMFSRVLVPGLLKIIATEYKCTSTINRVERFTIDFLSEMVHDNQVRGEAFYRMLEEELKQRFATDVAHTKLPGALFLDHIGHLHDLMLSLLKFPTTGIYEDERTSRALALMDYLRKKDESGNIRKEMYFRYVDFLVELHAELKNYQEAGITLLLEVDMLDWKDNMLEPRGEFPRESEKQRKERLLQNAISFFTTGQDWERAIEMCERLEAFYRYDVFDYDFLASVLRQEAELFHKIASTPRFYPSYYRVIFCGEFEDEENGNEYVYRGGRLEKVMNFTQRIKRKYPDAKLVMRWSPKEEDLKEHKKIIAITTLKLPSWQVIAEKELLSEEEKKRVLKLRSNPHVTEPVMQYFENNNRSVFMYEKPEQRAKEKRPANEFKELWIRQTFLVSEASFPTVRRRCRVVSKKEFMLTPIENATNLVHEKNCQILKEMKKVSAAAAEAMSAGGGMGSVKSPRSISNVGDRAPSGLPTARQSRKSIFSRNNSARGSIFGGGGTSSAMFSSPNASQKNLAVPGLNFNVSQKRLSVSNVNTPASETKKVEVNGLLALLQGTIDAGVNGGTKLFCEAFLTEGYIDTHNSETDSQHVNKLRERLIEQVGVLKEGLKLFGENCQDYRGLYEHLNATYNQKLLKSLEQYTS